MWHFILLECALFCQPLGQTTKLGTLYNSLCDQFVGSHEGQKLGTLCNSLCDQFAWSHKGRGGLWDELGLYNPPQVKRWYYKVILLHVSHVFWLNQHHALVTQLVEHGREFDSGRTTTQSPKITEEKVLPLQLHLHIVRLSSLLGYRTIKRRSRLTNTFHVHTFNVER